MTSIDEVTKILTTSLRVDVPRDLARIIAEYWLVSPVYVIVTLSKTSDIWRFDDYKWQRIVQVTPPRCAPMTGIF
jgi:hypothetical protein